MELKFKYFYSLIYFVIPTIIITIILFILDPPSITIIIGFCILLVAAVATYYLGIRGVLKESN
jgi:glucan phosphoethanolaminetransferase (alkaline phosphatase superfamily)